MIHPHTRKDFLSLGAISGASFLIGSLNLMPQKAVAATNVTDHPNVEVIKRYFQAYADGNVADVAREVFAETITWTIPGHHPLAGVKKGVDEVLAFFNQLGKAKFQAELLFLGGNDSYVVDVHRGWSNIGQNDIDQIWALLFRFEGGRITEVVNFPGDQHAADAFFWQVYPLKPIPERLA